MNEREIWTRVLELGWVADPADRLDAALALASELAQTGRAHLYLTAGDGRRLHLERTRGVSPPIPLPVDAEGGAAAALPVPPMELRVAADEVPRLVPTPEGAFFSLPLRRGPDLLGVVRVGPLPAGKLGKSQRKNLAATAQPLTVIVAGAHEADLLRRRAEDAEKRIAVGRQLQGSALETGRFVTLLLRLAVRGSRADGGFVALAGEEGLTLRAVESLPAELLAGLDLSAAAGLIEIVPDAEAAFLRDPEAAARLGIRSLLAVPLIAGGRAEALLALVDLGGEQLDPANLALLETLAEQIRLMLGNERLFDEFVARYLETVRAIATALDARRRATRGHHERVAAVAGALAAELGVGDDDRWSLRTAALVHDVGLAGVTATPDAYLADIEHPTIGAAMIEALPLARGVVEAVEGHHEWFDGWGFPRGLKGEQLHPLARILALAEFVVETAGGDAVQEAWSAERLAAELHDRRGSQFDPDAADALLRLLERGWRPENATDGGGAWST
ncbi:MAG: HD-GYP domain-containing protein [Gaiellaceae bacterium]